MATYLELAAFTGTTDGVALRDKISIAASIKAQALMDGVTPTAGEIAWANETLINPRAKADELINYVLAASNTASLAAIIAATDGSIQSQVDSAADALIAGGA